MLFSHKDFHRPVAWWIVVTAFLVMPGSDFPKANWFETIYLDKWIHIFFFSVLVYLFYQPFKTIAYNWAWLIAILCLAYGVAMEFVQKYWVIDRSFDVWDMVSDAIGCAAGYVYCNYRRRRRKSRNMRRSSRRKK
jgi:VanZ family protein